MTSKKPVDRKINDPASVMYEVEEHTKLLLYAMDEIGVRTHQAYGSTFVMPREQTFLTLQSVERYLNELNGKAEYRAMADMPVPYVKVKQIPYIDLAGMQRDGREFSTFYFSDPDDGGRFREYRQLLLLHEFAHYAGGGHGHSERFRKVMLKLVANEMSPELARYMEIRLYEQTQELKEMKRRENE